MNINANIAASCMNYANTLIQFTTLTPKSYLFFVSILMLTIWLLGRKLSRFIKPELPRASTVIREIASFLSLMSYLTILMFILYLLVIFLLALFGTSLNDQYREIGFFDVLGITSYQIWRVAHSELTAIIYGSIIGTTLSAYLIYFLIPDWERGEGLHDVKKIVKRFSRLDGFNPIPHFDIAKGCFIGLDLNKKPIYVDWKKIKETHCEVLGGSGTGKGVMMTQIAVQSAMAGECVIWFDPKNDSFSPKILSAFAKRLGKDFNIINLNPEQPPQFNLLADAKAHEIEELLVAGFDLAGKGTDGDFHRGKDEDAAILASKIAIEKNANSIPALFRECALVEGITNQENFWRKLSKLSDLEVINTAEGINLKDAILKKSIIYIIGSTDNLRVIALQKMLLVRVMQIIKGQDRALPLYPICGVLDEFKHILSPAALTGLGVIRDFKVHFLLAHQSLGDLDSCPGITRAQAEGAVLDNTAIKIIYRIGDSNYAEKLSKSSGKRPVFVENSNKNLDDNQKSTGGWRETHVPVIDADILTHLPLSTDRQGQANTGVIFGIGVAKLFYVGHIPVSGKSPMPEAALKYQINSVASGVDLI